MTQTSTDTGSRQSSRLLWLSFGTLAGMAVLAVLATAVVLEVQAGARAYLLGNTRWTVAQKEATYQLLLYLDLGKPKHLTLAREALAVPLSDRTARLALEREPPNVDRARRAFLRGGNAPEDIARLVRVYRYLSNAPYMDRAIKTWRLADTYILNIKGLLEQLQEARQQGSLDDAQRERFRERLIRLDRQVRPLAHAFADQLAAGARWLSTILVAITAGVFALMTLVSMGVYALLLRRTRESERDFRATFEQAAVGMAQLTGHGRFLAVNDAFCTILDRPRETLLASNMGSLIHPDDDVGEPWQLRRLADGELENYTTEKRYLRGDGEAIWGKTTLSAVRSRDTGPDRLFVVFEDVSEARRLAEALSYQATHDKLTGLINRHEMERRLQQAADTARTDGSRHTLMFIDLDQFKVVNDTCGHVAGDALLCHVANVLKHQLRANDTVGRLGGDEFAVILYGAPVGVAGPIADKVRTAIAEMAFRWEARSFNVTTSIGLVEVAADAHSVTWLLSAADTACYLAKDHGRNRVRTYEESDQSVAERRGQMEWVSHIRQAIDEDRLRLYAQHIAPLSGPDHLCYELLVRLVDRDGREFAPGSFLPAAERFDLASSVDRWVIATAITTLAAHPEHVRRLGLCHINVSAQSVTDADFVRFVEELLDGAAVPPERICFEITETAAMSSLQDAQRFMDAVHARGCAIALDDFGSGLSSFGYLKHLPVEILKIDGIFVRDISTDSLDLAIVSAIDQVAKALGKRTIAEFAEDDAVIAKLREIGVDYGQGFGIHRPQPLEDLLREADAATVRREKRGR